MIVRNACAHTTIVLPADSIAFAICRRYTSEIRKIIFVTMCVIKVVYILTLLTASSPSYLLYIQQNMKAHGERDHHRPHRRLHRRPGRPGGSPIHITDDTLHSRGGAGRGGGQGRIRLHRHDTPREGDPGRVSHYSLIREHRPWQVPPLHADVVQGAPRHIPEAEGLADDRRIRCGHRGGRGLRLRRQEGPGRFALRRDDWEGGRGEAPHIRRMEPLDAPGGRHSEAAPGLPGAPSRRDRDVPRVPQVLDRRVLVLHRGLEGQAPD